MHEGVVLRLFTADSNELRRYTTFFVRNLYESRAMVEQ